MTERWTYYSGKNKKNSWASATATGYHVYRTYKSKDEIENLITEGDNPLSGILDIMNNKIVCAIGSGRNDKRYVDIKLDDRGKNVDRDVAHDNHPWKCYEHYQGGNQCKQRWLSKCNPFSAPI